MPSTFLTGQTPLNQLQQNPTQNLPSARTQQLNRKQIQPQRQINLPSFFLVNLFKEEGKRGDGELFINVL